MPTYSVHDIADKRLARAVADYLEQERRHVEAAIEVYGEHVPFRRRIELCGGEAGTRGSMSRPEIR